ncbi:L-threonylcarbamoyladenylate synthase [Betaproteobacteria bacterium]|nr:L-threonylcarbamoyladenylate synthase [Betaproteobacteria bacterium]
MPQLTYEVNKAVDSLIRGKLVAFPTETVYGLGGDATNEEAVRRIYKVKGRPTDRPLILHVPDLATVKKVVLNWASTESKLASRFWPGPLTLILKNGGFISESASAGYKTVAVRIPSHPFALSMLESFAKVGSGVVAAPSANRFSFVSTTNAEDVEISLQNYLDKADMIVSSNSRDECKFGLESTIVDCSNGIPTILRVGVIKKTEIESCIGKPVRISKIEGRRQNSPGSSSIHYSPKTAFKMISNGEIKRDLLDLCEEGETFLWCFEKPVHTHQNLIAEVAPSCPREYGRQLYSKLNSLDREQLALILFEEPPKNEDWNAICDRLDKAKNRFCTKKL